MRRVVILAVSSLASCLDWQSLSREEASSSACVAFVVAGDTHSCARRTDGSMSCWGDNRFGQLGTGDRQSRATPARVALPAGVEIGKVYLPTGQGELSSDRAVFTCALATSGALYCWGDNRNGQLGTGDTSSADAPVLVGGLGPVERASNGAGHACAQTTDGALYCWGDNRFGQLGTGATEAARAPVRVLGFDADVDAVACGGFHTCAKRTDGRLYCWGNDAFGQLGIGRAGATQQPSPVEVTALGARVSRVATGGDHTCAILTDGTVTCWGDNRFGQLGAGDTAPRPGEMIDVRLPASATQVYTGRGHTCALLADATLYCWGANRYGELGTGDDEARSAPAQSGATELGNAVAAAYAGGGHTCSVRTDGAVHCWGNNQYGQLGVAGSAGSVAPAIVVPACR